MGGKKPSKVFKYPGGERMCHDGRIRAAEYGRQLHEGEVTADQVKQMAHKGEVAVGRGADTHKRNLIALIVYSLFKRDELGDYVTPEGDFKINERRVANLNDDEVVKIARRFRP